MKIFIDSANLEEIQAATKLGFCDGITTNPSLLAKENGAFTEIIEQIISNTTVPVCIEALSTSSKDIIAESIRIINTFSKQVMIKIPCTQSGLIAVRALRAQNIKTVVTLIFSPAQALLATKAGATYVCPFVGRIDDLSYDGLEVMRQITAIKDAYPDIKLSILAASIRSPLHVTELGYMGTDAVTVPFKVLKAMIKHPLTDIGIKQFEEAAEGNEN